MGDVFGAVRVGRNVFDAGGRKLEWLFGPDWTTPNPARISGHLVRLWTPEHDPFEK